MWGMSHMSLLSHTLPHWKARWDSKKQLDYTFCWLKDEMRWNEMKWNEMRCDWDGMGWDLIGLGRGYMSGFKAHQGGDGMGWDEIGWDEMRWDEMRCDWDGMRWDAMIWDVIGGGMGWEGIRLDEFWLGLDGMGWDEMRWDEISILMRSFNYFQ